MSKTACGCAVLGMMMLLTGSARAEMRQLESSSSSAQQRCDRLNWFPPPAHLAAYTAASQPAPTLDEINAHEQAIAPLPSAITTGLTSLGALGLFSARKGLKRFLFS